ncbi:MAG: TolC family protein, partial [Bacteriovoracia bacterium]
MKWGVLFFVLVLNGVVAQESLNLQEIVNRSIETSEQVLLKQQEKEINQAQYKEVTSKLYPHLNAEVKWTRAFSQSSVSSVIPSTSGPVISDIPLQQDYSLTGNITATQVLWTFGQIYNSIEAAGEAMDIGQKQVQLSKEEVAFQAKLSYYSLWLTKQSLDIARQSFLNAKKNAQLLKKRFRMGRPAQSDLIKLQADAEARTPSLKEAQAQYDSALLNLKRLLDWDYDKKLKISWPNLSKANFAKLNGSKLEKLAMNNGTMKKILEKSVKLCDEVI